MHPITVLSAVVFALTVSVNAKSIYKARISSSCFSLNHGNSPRPYSVIYSSVVGGTNAC